MMAFCPEHPKWDQNPKFTPLSETTSIPTPFICGVHPGAAMDHGTSTQAQHEGPTRRTPFRSTFQAKNKNYVVRIVCGFVVCSQPLAFSVTGHNRQNTINNPETFEEFTFFCFFFYCRRWYLVSKYSIFSISINLGRYPLKLKITTYI